MIMMTVREAVYTLGHAHAAEDAAFALADAAVEAANAELAFEGLGRFSFEMEMELSYYNERGIQWSMGTAGVPNKADEIASSYRLLSLRKNAWRGQARMNACEAQLGLTDAESLSDLAWKVLGTCDPDRDNQWTSHEIEHALDRLEAIVPEIACNEYCGPDDLPEWFRGERLFRFHKLITLLSSGFETTETQVADASGILEGFCHRYDVDMLINIESNQHAYCDLLGKEAVQEAVRRFNELEPGGPRLAQAAE